MSGIQFADRRKALRPRHGGTARSHPGHRRNDGGHPRTRGSADRAAGRYSPGACHHQAGRSGALRPRAGRCRPRPGDRPCRAGLSRRCWSNSGRSTWWFGSTKTARNDLNAIRATLISTPNGSRVSLGMVAEVIKTKGPNTINRENIVRRIVVQANAAGRDLASVVRDIQATANAKIVPKAARRILHRVWWPVPGQAGGQRAACCSGNVFYGRYPVVAV